MRCVALCVGLAQTVHGISIYCIYAVYDRIHAAFPYIPYMRENGFTQNRFIGGSFHAWCQVLESVLCVVFEGERGCFHGFLDCTEP